MPNAGKSSLISAVSRARPKIADYPFTTLHPNLGVVVNDDYSFVMVDIPGLIEGAHTGSGLGLRFLGHIERCKILIHMIDCTSEDVEKSYKTIRRELSLYKAGLEDKQSLILLTKSDLMDPAELDKLRKKFEKKIGHKVMTISAPTRAGIRELLNTLTEILTKKVEEPLTFE